MLPNPINLAGLKDVFDEPSVRALACGVVDLLNASLHNSAVDTAAVRKLAASRNGYILELLTFALSVGYENVPNALPDEGYLTLIKDVLESPALAPQTEYVMSLALYHINYFGRHATSDTLGLMSTVAERILKVHKGEFVILEHGEERRVNFNIVGTYGRALARQAGASPTSPALDYVRSALDTATKERDLAHYAYLCRNLGLLGVLVEPTGVLDVLARVLTELEGMGTDSLRFSAHEKSQVRTLVIQTLANIRVLHRRKVDGYLLDVIEDTKLQTEVHGTTPQFDLGTFFSWASEQLLFAMLTRYRDQIGRTFITALRNGLEEQNCFDALRVALATVFERLSALAHS